MRHADVSFDDTGPDGAILADAVFDDTSFDDVKKRGRVARRIHIKFYFKILYRFAADASCAATR